MADEYDGVGGSYIADPKTGKRTLVERTDGPQPEPVDTKVVQPKTDTKE